MSEREELEAVIADAVKDLPMRDCVAWGGELDRLRVREAIRAIATTLLSSGYTKGNGELVEAVPPNDWHPLRGGDFRQWGPWVRHDGGARPENVRFDDGKGFHGDPVVYLTQSGSGVGRNHSPYWPDIKWYRLPSNHSFYRKALSDSEGVAPSGGDGWQPIETAPKDGVWIIAWDGDAVQPVAWVDDAYHDGMPSGRYTGWCTGDVSWGGVLFEGVHDVDLAPTHWMPLPTPPAQDTQRAERATNGDHHDEGQQP